MIKFLSLFLLLSCYSYAGIFQMLRHSEKLIDKKEFHHKQLAMTEMRTHVAMGVNGVLGLALGGVQQTVQLVWEKKNLPKQEEDYSELSDRRLKLTLILNELAKSHPQLEGRVLEIVEQIEQQVIKVSNKLLTEDLPLNNWNVSLLRLDFSIGAEGIVYPGVKVGADIRFSILLPVNQSITIPLGPEVHNEETVSKHFVLSGMRVGLKIDGSGDFQIIKLKAGTHIRLYLKRSEDASQLRSVLSYKNKFMRRVNKTIKKIDRWIDKPHTEKKWYLKKFDIDTVLKPSGELGFVDVKTSPTFRLEFQRKNEWDPSKRERFELRFRVRAFGAFEVPMAANVKISETTEFLFR